MGCTDEVPSGAAPVVERELMLPAPPADVWEALPSLLGDDVDLVPEPGGRLHAGGPEGERIGVVEEFDAPHRLAFWWVPAGDDNVDTSPSMVEVELFATQGDGSAVGTLLRVRETRFDAAVVVDGLLRGPLARARA